MCLKKKRYNYELRFANNLVGAKVVRVLVEESEERESIIGGLTRFLDWIAFETESRRVNNKGHVV